MKAAHRRNRGKRVIVILYFWALHGKRRRRRVYGVNTWGNVYSYVWEESR